MKVFFIVYAVGTSGKLSRMNLKVWNFKDCLFGKLKSLNEFAIEGYLLNPRKTRMFDKTKRRQFQHIANRDSSKVVLMFMVRIYSISDMMIDLASLIKSRNIST